MFESFEQKLEQKFASDRPQQAQGSRPPLVCFYCHREGHGTARCFELQKDKDDKLVEQKGTNFSLPNGALIPWDSSRPIRHVVASFQPSRQTTNQATVESSPGSKVGCGSLQPWYPPAVSSQSFLGVYEADPAGRKRHGDPKPFKAPSVPYSAAKRPLQRAPTPPVPEDRSAMDEELILFERGTGREDPSELAADTPLASAPPAKSASPKVRFEREVSREHPNAVDGVLKKISILKVPDITVSELMAISPSIAEGMKKWVSRRRVEVGSEELKVNSGTLVEVSNRDLGLDPNLYSCPLGHLPCFIGDDKASASPLVDSGSQLNLISDTMATQFNLSPRVNFTSAVYGINNQACELMGVTEDVQIRISKTLVKTCHFWITKMDGPLILGRPFLMDVAATLAFSSQSGEKLIVPDAAGRNIEVSLCLTGSG
ncbi:hypothetical protein PTTG_29317 [Puccinia triticina 1-1 BBBD Race 1]|uniref:Aspartic peptidase DDI1-type domain-containing protein n=1 Tax=Puccinia triticina (isolate 1-1 / race 1 (BBBD)) TaxID=630390 RepID=A0A180G4Y6_PUCT1|nr:hypothetical protein PTTG_29317 [Puccinia triticina 1-1 BBBD Race 1]